MSRTRAASGDGGQWQLVLAGGDRQGDQPLFVQIAHAISGDIVRGRLRPGARMPGTRTLAGQLGVNRNTVVAAYAELTAQGWLVAGPARGTFVHGDIDAPRRVGRREPADSSSRAPGFELVPSDDVRFGPPLQSPLDPAATEPCKYYLTGGRPDPRLIPTDLLARAYRRALRREGQRVLDYGSPFGHARLRAALAEMLASVRGLAVDADGLIVTRGSQMAIDLICASLLRPGDRVAVEAYGYPPAWAAMRKHGAALCPVEVDDEGMRVEQLEALLTGGPLRAVYLTPHHQYPTMSTLSPARRLALLALARRHRIAIIEDDYDHEFHYDGRPVLPLASADRHGVVIYVGSLSKVLAPGLRIGYVVAPSALIERLARMRRFIDRQGDLAVEAALSELMEDGDIQRHIWRVRRAYQARRDAFVAALARELPDVLDYDVPAGGIAMWARAVGVDVEAWAQAAWDAGALVLPARHLRIDGRRRPYLRLGYTRHTERELARGVKLLASVLPRTSR